jgi:FkbM family methyltransferase
MSGGLLERFRTHRIHQVIACARQVRGPLRFFAREVWARFGPGRPRLRGYPLRASGLWIWLHHGTEDLGVIDEVFHLGWYELPDGAVRRLERLGRPPRVADLGAHIGSFDVHLLGRFPGAAVTAVEPDASNAEALERCMHANRGAGTWKLLRACAAARPGTVRFIAGESTASRVANAGEEGAVEVPALDALPLLAEADVVKMDMEGGEWEILADSRFRELRPAVMVLEYHPHLCPHPDPRGAVEGLLAEMGYDVQPIFHESSGVGMVWALSR